MKVLFLMLLALLPIAAQVVVQFSPEPMAVLAPYNVRNVGKWAIAACNDGSAAVTIPPERFRMAAPGIHLLTPGDARTVIAHGLGRSKSAIAVEILSYAALGVAALAGQEWIVANPAAVKGLTVGTGIGLSVANKLRGRLPILTNLFEGELRDPETLPPGGCMTRIAFAGKVKTARTITARIEVH